MAQLLLSVAPEVNVTSPGAAPMSAATDARAASTASNASSAGG